jgi:hypothetical protein
VIGVYGTTTDITERKLRELEKVKSRQKAMGKMLNLLAHHWPQPMGTISMIASNIQFQEEMYSGRKPRIVGQVASIQRKSQEFSETINQVQ